VVVTAVVYLEKMVITAAVLEIQVTPVVVVLKTQVGLPVETGVVPLQEP
jgi:hypothetical protein